MSNTNSRNQAWANDKSGFGYQMLTKMGWKGQGSGLGKNEDGMSQHVRVRRRVADSGIGTESWSSTKGGGPSGTANRIDAAAGQKTWQQTNSNFADVLAQLNASCEDEVTKLKKRKKESKKKEQKKEKKRRKVSNDNAGSMSPSGIRAARAKMIREKDIKSRS